MDVVGVLDETVTYIEKNAGEKLTVDDIADHVYVSPAHLQRIFSFVFDMPIAQYVRSRKLYNSLELLYTTGRSVTDVAYDVGFGHESSFIRSFKREYGITPSDARKNPKIVEVMPPLTVPEFSGVDEGLLSGIDFVMIPEMDVIGKLWEIPFAESEEMAPAAAFQFWDQEAGQIANKLDDNIYIGLTHYAGEGKDFSYYMPSVMVGKDATAPQGFVKDHIASGMGLRFKYIGHHSYRDLNSRVASAMYKQIDEFAASQDRYVMPYEYYFEKVDKSQCDEDFCMMEWYTPVVIK